MIDITENAIKRIKDISTKQDSIYSEFPLMVEVVKASHINFLLIKLNEVMTSRLNLMKSQS